jgi:hypothetical protein
MTFSFLNMGICQFSISEQQMGSLLINNKSFNSNEDNIVKIEFWQKTKGRQQFILTKSLVYETAKKFNYIIVLNDKTETIDTSFKLIRDTNNRIVLYERYTYKTNKEMDSIIYGDSTILIKKFVNGIEKSLHSHKFSKLFDTIQINSTHYNDLDLDTLTHESLRIMYDSSSFLVMKFFNSEKTENKYLEIYTDKLEFYKSREVLGESCYRTSIAHYNHSGLLQEYRVEVLCKGKKKIELQEHYEYNSSNQLILYKEYLFERRKPVNQIQYEWIKQDQYWVCISKSKGDKKSFKKIYYRSLSNEE